jgi:hypothetical protein
MKAPSSFAVQALLPLMLSAGGAALAQQLDAHFSCSAVRDNEGERTTYADNGEIRIDGNRIDAFHWESALFRSTHGFDCSVDDTDGLQAEVREDKKNAMWRISLADARATRDRRGFGFDRGLNCTIRLERDGDMLNVKPSCPALCGSRANFSELSVNLKTGQCRYEE